MSGPPVPPGKTSAGKLVVLMVTAFMDMVGVLMIVPLMPFYAKHMGAGGFVVGAFMLRVPTTRRSVIDGAAVAAVLSALAVAGSLWAAGR